jgi:hypothetical protein
MKQLLAAVMFMALVLLAFHDAVPGSSFGPGPDAALRELACRLHFH